MYKILFVCTGNICRSPTAEGVMRHLVFEEGLSEHIHVDSAAVTHQHVGEAPDKRSAATAKKYGVSLEGQAARQVTANDFTEFDLILAMDFGHYRKLQSMAPDSCEAVYLFLDYSAVPKYDEVPDPYYGGTEGFEDVYALIHDGCSRLLDRVRHELGI